MPAARGPHGPAGAPVGGAPVGALVEPDGHNGVRGEKAGSSAPVLAPGTSISVVIKGDPAVPAQDVAGSAEQSPQLPIRFVAARNGYIGIAPTGKIVLEEGRPHRVGKKGCPIFQQSTPDVGLIIGLTEATPSLTLKSNVGVPLLEPSANK